MGLCTGLLAAAAVASSPALPALVPLGVEVVLIAFRTGLCVGTAARSLELSRDGAASWSFIVTGTDDKEAQAAITAFHKEKVCVFSPSHDDQRLIRSLENPKVEACLHKCCQQKRSYDKRPPNHYKETLRVCNHRKPKTTNPCSRPLSCIAPL